MQGEGSEVDMRASVKLGARDRRVAVRRFKKLSDILVRDDVSGAVALVERGRYDFLGKPGCARIDPLHRRDFSICWRCANFDRMDLFCRIGETFSGKWRS